MIVATAGHIDHGKTVLVRALSGVDTDRLPEEKRRGMSIDLGYAYRSLGETERLGFIDVPGHERFVANMLAGVTGIDFALLVVAADDGPMPQTREHLAILNLLGIDHGAVAITKIDRVESDRVEAVVEDVQAMLSETVLSDAEVFRVSGISGEGVDDLRDYLDAAATVLSGPDAPRGNFRLAIDRAFTLQGAGLVATGTVFSGAVNVGDTLVVSPEGLRVRVRSLHAQNQEAQAAGIGERCALNITGNELRRYKVRRGDWLVSETAHAPTARLDIRLQVLESERRVFRHWTPVHVHVGAEHVTGRAALLDARSLEPGESGWAQLVLDREIGALAGDRIVLRDQSAQRTVGGGPVIDPFPPRRGRAKPERLKALETLLGHDPGHLLESLCGASPQGVSLSQFAVARNLRDDEIERVTNETDLAFVGPQGSRLAITAARRDVLESTILQTLSDSHEQEPGKPGLSIHALREQQPERVNPDLLDAMLHALSEGGQIEQSGGIYRLPGHRAELTDQDAKLWARLEPMLEDESLRPPTISELANQVGQSKRPVERMLARAARLGLIVRVTDNRYFLSSGLQELADIVESAASSNPDGTFSVAEFRDRTSIGRNLAIELLEYFDRTGFTARQGDRRRLLRPAQDALSAA